jgi:hypothetical protein
VEADFQRKRLWKCERGGVDDLKRENTIILRAATEGGPGRRLFDQSSRRGQPAEPCGRGVIVH